MNKQWYCRLYLQGGGTISYPATEDQANEHVRFWKEEFCKPVEERPAKGCSFLERNDGQMFHAVDRRFVIAADRYLKEVWLEDPTFAATAEEG